MTHDEARAMFVPGPSVQAETSVGAALGQLGLAERISWERGITSTRVPERLRTFSLLVQPSLTRGHWKEQFGRALVEAMACGTPVIARSRGSMSEIVRDGENGFLVSSLAEAVVAVHASDGMDRMAVRTSVEHRFDSNRMVDDYLAVYHRVVELHRTRRADEGNAR